MNADKHRFRELILHDLVQDYDDRLFARLYREVFSPSFRENELESADDMRLQIRDRTGIQLIVAVDRTDVPVAAITAYLYARSGVLLLGYLAVRTEYRDSGIGTWLAAQAKGRLIDSIRPRLAIAEVEDPRRFSASSRFGDPVGRLRLYDRLGGLIIQMPYFQPRLRPETHRVYNLLPMAFAVAPSALLPGRSDCVRSEVLTAFLDEYFETAEGAETLNHDDEYRSLRATVAAAACLPMLSVDAFLRLPPDHNA